MTGLPASFPVRVCMLSDWIVGTGEGRVGDVDATVRRGYDGLPFIPAKTLTGIWRDGCEQVVALLASTQPGIAPASGLSPASPWQAWLDWIFGSQPDERADRTAERRLAPQRAQLALSPARLSGPVRAACRGKPALLAAAVVLRPGVKIDDQTGVASEDMLRLEERARPGWLEAQADFPFLPGTELPPAAELLLRAGAAAVDALGGKRNRGSGRCWILPPGIGGQAGVDQDSTAVPSPAAARPADQRLAELAAGAGLLDDPGERPALRLPAAKLAPFAGSAPSRDPGSPDPARVTRRVTLEVVTPLVAQDRVLGNVTLSRDWIPGTVLLPVILSRLSRPVGHLDIVVGDARPAAGSGSEVIPGAPVPMVWYRPKDKRLGQLVNAAQRQPGPAERMMPMRSGHIARAGDGTWSLLAPDLAVSTHAVIGDDTGRPDDGRGGVFSYLGIAPGTLLAFDVVLPGDVELTLAAGEMLRLGRSRKDDFGQVTVRRVEAVTAPSRAGLRAGEQVRLWCVSDVLLRDAWGASDPSPHALAAALSGRLGLTPGLRVVEPRPGEAVVHAYRAGRRESVHTRWNRPRPSLTGLAAGSVITLAAQAAIPAAALAAIERDGIGERTAEGFGQVRFGAPELTAAEPIVTPPGTLHATDPAADQPSPDGPLPAVPHVLEEAAVKAEIARRVAALVTPDSGIDRVIPGASRVESRAQWGVLREQLPRLASPAGRDAVAAWLEQTRSVRTRRIEWSEPAIDALKRLLTDPGAVWSDLDLAGTALDQFALAPERAGPIRAALWPHVVSVLLTETARTATRRLQGASGEQDSR